MKTWAFLGICLIFDPKILKAFRALRTMKATRYIQYPDYWIVVTFSDSMQ